MLYLVKVNLSMEWSDLPARTVLRAVAEHGASLDGVEWEPAKRIANDTTVALALRHGAICSRGIVMDGMYPTLQSQPAHIAETHRRAVEAQANLHKEHELIEKLLPGSAEHRRGLDAGVEQSVVYAISQAEDRIAQALTAPVVPELVEHWRSLGGHLPREADEQRPRRRSSGAL